MTSPLQGNLQTEQQPEIPDGKLVEMVLRGDKTAFEQFVHRYQRALLNLASRKLPRQELAEEAVQETFLAAFKSLHTYNSQFAFRTWLWTILINQCHRINSKKSNAETPNGMFAADLSAHVSDEKIPDEQAADRETQDRLQALLDQISPVKATALRLRFFEGMKYREIAQHMHSSHSAAKKRVRLGLADIAEKMKQSTKRKSEQSDRGQK